MSGFRARADASNELLETLLDWRWDGSDARHAVRWMFCDVDYGQRELEGGSCESEQ